MAENHEVIDVIKDNENIEITKEEKRANYGKKKAEKASETKSLAEIVKTEAKEEIKAKVEIPKESEIKEEVKATEVAEVKENVKEDVKPVVIPKKQTVKGKVISAGKLHIVVKTEGGNSIRINGKHSYKVGDTVEV